MRYSLIAFLTTFLLSSISNSQKANPESIKGFNQYLKENNKHYNNLAEYNLRFALYLDSALKVTEINNQHDTFTAGLNKFSDMTPEEKEAYKGKKVSSELPNLQQLVDSLQNRLLEGTDPFEGLPRQVDWKANGKITSVKDQKNCGSCTMFATAALLESWLLTYPDPTNKYPNTPQNLSEQQLVDCTFYRKSKYSNYGCDGGWNYRNMNYMKDYPIRTEASYPYKAKTMKCKGASNGIVKIYNYGIVPINSTKKFFEQLSKSPIAIGFFASDAFMSYKSGVFNHTTCSSSSSPNHAVLAVGYDLDATPPYILLKNSWGTTWGESGYFRISFDYVDQSRGPCNMFVDEDNVYIIDPPSN